MVVRRLLTVGMVRALSDPVARHVMQARKST
jgi:hypothetical protein